MTKRAIGLAEYNQLSEEEQLNILYRDGVYVGKRKIEKQAVVLFQLYGFYVEVHYKHYRKQIDHTISSDNIEMLQLYIDQVEVRDLKVKKD